MLRGLGVRSQCTFWCSVLSDLAIWESVTPGLFVSMHLLVLSAFRLDLMVHRIHLVRDESQCTFWCSVLSDFE